VHLPLIAIGSGTDIFASYEFASDESVNSLTCVSLETTSTESGTKNFIAVGATINQGEFLAVK
jgi:cleavage and polyadenylation specificity factor subunit 1